MLLAAATQSPIQFGPYLLTECIGQGGMAVVYKAVRQGPSGFTKVVVVKAMLPALSAQREFVAMFSGEARLMAQLSHPNIVQVHDFGVVDGIPYLVMEHLSGRNLSQLRSAIAARGQRMPVGCALAIAREMCHGLGYAHDFVDAEGRRRQIIHRDVSPSNVMVGRDGAVKLLDFGVAKIVGEFDYDVTQSFKGKYAYMSPEQVNHQPIDRRVDVFAAGVLLHELLTGKRLFAAETELETLQRVSAAQVVAPSVDNRDVPRALDIIVKKALARDPGERYMSGAAMAEALETLDALAWSRKRLAAYVAELFANDWMVVCEVCGKQVMPGAECGECGTAAPEVESPVAVDPEARAVSARQALMPLLNTMNTERNVVGDEGAAPAPTAGSDPLPLPPPPQASRRARPKLSVVRTPIAPPQNWPASPSPQAMTQPTPPNPSLAAVAAVAPKPMTQATPPNPSTPPPSLSTPPPDPAAETRVAPNPAAETVVARPLPQPAGPPHLFVVPRAEQTPVTPAVTPLPRPSPFSATRPVAPQPMFVMPPMPPAAPLPRPPRLVFYTTAAAAIGLVALVVALLIQHPVPADAPSLAPPATLEPPPPPTVRTVQLPAPTASPRPPTIPAAVPEPAVEPIAPSAPPRTPIKAGIPLGTASREAPRLAPLGSPIVRASSHHRPSRPRPAASAAVAPAEPERTVKEGRIVDPFAGLK
jgi:Protein kinase domain